MKEGMNVVARSNISSLAAWFRSNTLATKSSTWLIPEDSNAKTLQGTLRLDSRVFLACAHRNTLVVSEIYEVSFYPKHKINLNSSPLVQNNRWTKGKSSTK